MGKVKVPRNWRKTKDNFFSHLFHFTSSKAWIWLSLIFTIIIMNGLGIDGHDVTTTGLVFTGLIVLFIGLPLFFNLKYFRDIPEDWTWEQMQELEKIKGKTHKIVDVFSRKYWLSVLCVVSIFVGLGIAFNEIGLVAIVPGILIISFFAYVYVTVQRKRREQPRSEAQERNSMAIFKASYNAKYGEANKSVLKKMAVAVIFVIGFFFFSIGGKFPILSEMQLIILVVGVASLVAGVVIWRSIKNDGLSNNEKTLRKLRKKYGMKN